MFVSIQLGCEECKIPSLLKGGDIRKCSVWSVEDYSRLEFIGACKSNHNLPWQ